MLEPPVAFNILIVDDDKSTGATLLAILRRAGHQGQWVTTGADAAQVALDYQTSGRQLHAALIDVRLPDTSGLDVLRGVKSMHPEVGAVIMTGYADTMTAIHAINDGAFAYVQKPYNIDEIKAILARIAERQKLVRDKREATVLLETTVAQRTLELRHANLQLLETIKKLQAADAVKSKFVAMVSHELRTPLTIIMGFSETIMRKVGVIEVAQMQSYAKVIHSSSMRLSRLIEDMLNLSRMQDESMRLVWARFNFKELAVGVIDGFKITRPDLRFELSVEEGLADIFSDKDRVEQIVVNILGNAVKYSPPDGRISVTMKTAETEVVTRVEDEGFGIPEEDRAKIFEAFYRTADAVNLKTPGTGLGLTITKAVVEALGGWIRVEGGREGRGSAFVFALPREPKENIKTTQESKGG